MFCQLITRVLQKKNKWLFLDNSLVGAQKSVDQLWQELDHYDVSCGAGELKIANVY